MIIPKALQEIEKADLEDLVAREVTENKHIEYKLTLPSDKSEKRDLLADISAFANADGGDILFGVREKIEDGKNTGLPEAFLGLRGANIDQEILRLQNLIRDGLEPSLQVEMRAVPGFEQGPVLVVRVPQSWNSPHMIKSSPCFYVRSNNGNNPLGVQEIRQVFLLSQTIEGRMREFRDERLARILSDEAAVPLIEGPRVVFHILPFISFANQERLSFARLRELDGYLKRPFFGGLVVDQSQIEGRAKRYRAIFVNGAFEIVLARIAIASSERMLVTNRFERQGPTECQHAIMALQKLEIPLPYVISLALVGAKGYRVHVSQDTMILTAGPQPFQRDVLVTPEALMERFDTSIEDLLAPLLTSIWNAAGYYEKPQ